MTTRDPTMIHCGSRRSMFSCKSRVLHALKSNQTCEEVSSESSQLVVAKVSLGNGRGRDEGGIPSFQSLNGCAALLLGLRWLVQPCQTVLVKYQTLCSALWNCPMEKNRMSTYRNRLGTQHTHTRVIVSRPKSSMHVAMSPRSSSTIPQPSSMLRVLRGGRLDF